MIVSRMLYNQQLCDKKITTQHNTRVLYYVN